MKKTLFKKIDIPDDVNEIQIRAIPHRTIKLQALRTDGKRKPYNLYTTRKENLELK